MFIFFSITSLYILAYFWARSKFIEITKAGGVIGYLFILQFLLVEFDFGPTSGRIYLSMTMLGIYLANCLIQRTSIFLTKRSKALFIAGLCYFAVAFLSVLAFGNLSKSVINQFLSYFVFALSAFICIQGYLRSAADIKFVLAVAVFIAAANGFVAVYQWRGDGWAWNLYATLRPLTWEYRQENSEVLSFGYSPGLQEYSIQLSFLLIFCLSAWVWLLNIRKVASWQGFWLFIAFVLGEFGTIAALSRSSLLAYNLLAFAYLLYRLFGTKVTVGTKFYLILATCLAGLAFWLVSSALDISIFSEDSELTAARITRFDSSGREDVWEVAFELILEYPLWGSGLTEFSSRVGYATAPHNMFLNATVYYGIFGFLSLANIVFRAFVLIKVLVSRVYYHKILAWACALPLIGYLFKGMFHNDSFANGGILGWMMLGLCCAVYNLERETVLNAQKYQNAVPSNTN